MCGFAEYLYQGGTKSRGRIGAPIIPSSSPIPPESALSVSQDHGAATRCCTVYFDQSFAKRRVESKPIASEASCSVRAVQRIRLKRQQFEMPNPRTNCVGRRSCVTPPMRKVLYDILIEQPYLYRCKLADFLYRRFCRRISERSISRTLLSMGWTRTTVHRIAQQWDANLRDHYLHRISQYKSYQLVFVDESGCDGRAGHRRWGWSPKGSSQSRLQSSVAEKDGTFFQHTRKMASC